MAQLSDDCFAHGGRLMPLAEALSAIAERSVVLCDSEVQPLADCLGRILAEPLVCAFDVPPHANSAVDGYAVFHADLSADRETRLPVTGRVAAGTSLGRAAKPGEAIRIFTGAPLPEGPDTVMMQEDCRLEGDTVIIAPGIKKGANSRRAGEDIKAGSQVLVPGQRLRAQDLGQAAAAGNTALKVYRPLRIALFSTGNELRQPGTALEPGSIYDSNRFTLLGLLKGLGCTITDLGILPDRHAVIRDALEVAAKSHDVIVTSGGVSVGEEDHMKQAVEDLGKLHLWRLAIKPGRPIALGQVGVVPFVGLPGNPVAVMVTFLNVVRPLLLGLMGARDVTARRFKVRADFTHKKKVDRREWVRATLSPLPDGGWAASKFPRQGAGILSSMVESDGLVELGEDVTELAPGTMVDFLPFSEVMP
ncbi:molybdopterin molybdotransferase MoeA [Limibacillus halophilus]|uniref:Molybdopterin molybdenumtransferase n=1 Tax=Limibacillus halophilus TaxID=1579333 RepID=A0A839SS94_9PROT|nr:gephyrin-like molybdotransferase Glp [Limibacillus halophilus]MBB3065342.1 molybdopterin molybdotransferase [Limibacillus halophilus]